VPCMTYDADDVVQQVPVFAVWRLLGHFLVVGLLMLEECICCGEFIL